MTLALAADTASATLKHSYTLDRDCAIIVGDW